MLSIWRAVSCLEWQFVSITHQIVYLQRWTVALKRHNSPLRLPCIMMYIRRGERMLGRSIAISGVVAVVILIITLQLTTPSTIGPLGLLFVFILLYVAILSMLTFLLYLANRVIVRMGQTMTVRRPLRSLTLQRAYYYGSVISLAPVMLIGMQSVGVVGIYEVLLIVVFTALTCVYIAKRTS